MLCGASNKTAFGLTSVTSLLNIHLINSTTTDKELDIVKGTIYDEMGLDGTVSPVKPFPISPSTCITFLITVLM